MSTLLLDREFVITLASKALGDVTGTVVYADRVARGPGVVTLGGASTHVARPALLAFRDEMPGANWMHPCTYALVDVESGVVVARVASDRPPAFGWLPETWIVAADPDGRADLLPPSRRDP